jgi:hypothetical protein
MKEESRNMLSGKYAVVADVSQGSGKRSRSDRLSDGRGCQPNDTKSKDNRLFH